MTLAASVISAPGASAVVGKRPTPQSVKPVPGTSRVTPPVTHVGSLPTASKHIRPPAPAAGSAIVTIPAPASGAPVNAAPAKAGSLPVRLGAPVGGASVAGPQVRVEVTSQAAAQAAGVNGLLMSLSPASGNGGAATVGVDTSALAGLSGAGFESRLRLVKLPACALTTPQIAACRTQTPIVGATMDSGNHTLSATVTLPEAAQPASAPRTADSASAANTAAPTAAAATPLVLAATATTSGPSGTFAATSLAPSSQWTAGNNSGDFTWSYNLAAPKPFAGAAPAMSLAYDSGSVDGRTDSTNNQSSPVGEGFELGAGGFIERSYKSCSELTDLPTTSQTGDECWAGQVLNLSLGGKSTALVWDPSSGQVHPADDNGERVQLLTAASNGALNGEYWKVTSTDGTQYYFGRNHGPGYTSQANTNSTWTVPVYGAHSGDPCYNATFAQASCLQAWRWNLDYIEDVHGNVTMLYYTPETNYYTPDAGQNSAKPVQYTRGGVLEHIEYGLRDDNGTVYANPAVDKIVFNSAERCIPNENNNGFSCDPSLFTAANAGNWHDVPFDQNCAQGATCSNYSPTFWSRRRITGVTTQVYTGGGYKNVDVYNFTQAYPEPGDGTPATLALAGVQHCGSDGTTCTPAVQFLGTMKANRVPVPGPNNAYYPPINKWRVTEIDTETGEQIQIGYNTPACSPTNLPASDSTNTSDCYPQYWSPLGATKPVESYFYHYLVGSVTEADPTGGAPSKVTRYTYVGGAAWHFDDSELAKAAQRTYAMFRGYSHVQARVGVNPTSLTDTLFFRGMDGDMLPGGGKRSVTVSDLENDDTVTDANALAGQVFETDAYTADGGTVDHATVTDYGITGPTATRSRTGLNPLQALMVRTTRERTRQALAQPAGTWRRTVTNTAYNPQGLPTQVDDESDGTQPRCTRTGYLTNTTAWLTVPNRVTETAEICPSGAQAGTLVSDTKTSYDNQAWGTAPTVGNATSVATASATTGGVAGITAYATATTSFDGYGRKTGATDAMGRASSIAYTPATLGPVTQEVDTALVSTDPLSRSTTTIYEPLRGLTAASIDVAGLRSEGTFDALGRLTQAWIPGRSKAGGQTPDSIYSYTISNTGPSVVTTQSLMDDNTYAVKQDLYDSLLRKRQTQSEAEGGGRIVADSVYNDRGLEVVTNHNYYATGAPTTSIYLPKGGDAAIPDQTVNTFDGLGRVVKAAEYHYANYTWETDSVYGGDRVTTIPPTGGTATTTITNARDANAEIDQYTATPTVTGNTVTGPINGVGTKYGYDPVGNLASVTDPTGANTWQYTYDLRGRKLTSTDPDTGKMQYTYDDDGEMLTSLDARGKTIAYKWDNLGRKLGEYVGTTSGPAVARWTYDTLMKGKPTASASYVNGLAYITATAGYTTAGLPTGTKVTIPSGESWLTGTYTTTFGYTPNTNKVASITEPAAGPFASEIVNTTYTHLGNPATTQGQNYYVSATSYDSFGKPVQYTQGPSSNPVWQTFGYDDQTQRKTEVRIDQQAAPPQVDKTDYSYNADGQITKITDLRGGSTTDTQCFGYDGLDQLTQAWSATDNCSANPVSAGNATVGGPIAPYWTSWTYDPAGNRRTQTQHALPGATGGDSTTTYNYPAPGQAQPHTLTGTTTTGPGAGSTAYQYDTAGNMLTRTTPANGAQSLNWDEANRLTSITAGANTTNYVYSADGELLMRKGNGVNTLYLGDTELVWNTTGTTVTGTRYYKHGQDVVASLDSTTGHLNYLMPDRQGSADVSLDATTMAATFRSYTPYGDAREASPGTWPGQRGWLGAGIGDATTGLTNLGAREYEPSTGRFISRDSVFTADDAQNIGGYTYSGNDPVDKMDPTGLFWGSGWLKKHKIIAAVVAVAVVVAVPALAPIAIEAAVTSEVGLAAAAAVSASPALSAAVAIGTGAATAYMSSGGNPEAAAGGAAAGVARSVAPKIAPRVLGMAADAADQLLGADSNPVYTGIENTMVDLGDRPNGKGATKGAAIGADSDGNFQKGYAWKSNRQDPDVAQEIHDHLVASGVPVPPTVGGQTPLNPTVDHVEVKQAWYMRKNGITESDVVINNQGGPCSSQYACTDSVAAILPPGSTLHVWYPDPDGGVIHTKIGGRALL